MLYPSQALAMAENLERAFEIVRAFGEMRPALGAQRHNRRAGESAGRLDGVVGVHGQVEFAARLRRARKQQHEARLEPPLHLGNAVEPYGVARNIDGFERIRFRREYEADDIAR